MADELHSQKDEELEHRDQQMFGRVVLLAGAALAVVFVLALLFVRIAAGHIQVVKPANHPTSQLVMRSSARELV